MRYPDSERPVCRYNDGVWCDFARCRILCGWRPEEIRRRRKKIRRQGLTLDENGRHSLHVREGDYFGW